MSRRVGYTVDAHRRAFKSAEQWARYGTQNLRVLWSNPRPSLVSISGVGHHDVDPANVHVVMCTWRRLSNLERTLDDLRQQTGPSIHLHTWNNNWGARQSLDRALASPPIPVRVFHSENNTGGFGRFFVARDLVSQGLAGRDPVIFIDDDQRLGPDAVAQLVSEYHPGCLSGTWAFRFTDSRSYWIRQRAVPGEQADYVGTGGLVCPLWLFREPLMFQCPHRFWFVEDLWLSHVSRSFGLELRSSNADIRIVRDHLDQYYGLQFRKSRFFRYLRNRGGWPDIENSR